MGRDLRVLVSGMVAGDAHQGGATWAVLQYVLGLKSLGHDVWFVEPLAQHRLVPSGVSLVQSDNAKYFREVTATFEISDRAALLATPTRDTVGVPYHRILAAARHADLLINISGMLEDEHLLGAVSRRVFLDLDPTFNQLWHAVQGINLRFDNHTHFVTIGMALGSPGCPVPTCGLRWATTLQPIVLKEWARTTTPPQYGFTTVGNWRGYGAIQHQGILYGQKAHSFRQFMTLPTLTTERFSVAVAIHPDEKADLAALGVHRWELLDPARVAGTPDGYRSFIRASKAEFGIAKSGYVASKCGWFSDRSVCYLASGRPVIAQDTGFSRYLPCGTGLLPFTAMDDVLAAIDAINSDYERHSCAARVLAEEYFDSNKILPKLLDSIGGSN